LTVFESKIIEAAGTCKCFSDIINFGNLYGFTDMEMFSELVAECQEFKKGLN